MRGCVVSYILVNNQVLHPHGCCRSYSIADEVESGSHRLDIGVLAEPQASFAAVPGNPNAQEPSKLSQIPYLETVINIISKLISNSLIAGPKYIIDIVNEEEDD